MRRSALAASTAAGLALAMSVTLAPGAGAAPAPDSAARLGQAPSPDKVTMPTRVRGQAGKGGGGSPISYHKGGAVMTDPTGVNVYYIWYGDWSYDAKASTILTTLAQNIGGSTYFGINTTYYDGAKKYVKNQVTYKGSIGMSDATHGTTLSDLDIQSIVSDAIKAGLGGGTADANAVYFVLTAKNVTESSGFVTKYCGWHTYGSINSTTVKYSFVGDATQQGLSSCAVQTTTSPNGDPGADAMASVIAHELEEAVTDPQLNAWFDGRGYENADKCAWTFGTTYPSNGAQANVNFGGLDYLIQRNWSASRQACGMS